MVQVFESGYNNLRNYIKAIEIKCSVPAWSGMKTGVVDLENHKLKGLVIDKIKSPKYNTSSGFK